MMCYYLNIHFQGQRVKYETKRSILLNTMFQKCNYINKVEHLILQKAGSSIDLTGSIVILRV